MGENRVNDPAAFIAYVKSCREKGMSETEIARKLGVSTSEYRRLNSEARDAIRKKG